MKRFVTAVIAILFAVSLHAQTAQVIQLSPEDAAKAKQLQQEQADLIKRAEAFHAHIVRDYLVTTSEQEAGRCCDNIFSDPNDKQDKINFTASIVTLNNVMLFNGEEPRCATPEEKAASDAAKKKAEEEREAYEKAHPTKYIKSGWTNPGNYELSEDFKYIVPARESESPRPVSSAWLTVHTPSEVQ